MESTRKTEQDRPCRKFWLLVKGQRKSQSQLVQGQSQRILVRVGSGFLGRVTGRAVKPLMSSYDVSLTWTRVDVDVLAWLLTSSYDVRWHQQQYRHVAGTCNVHWRVEEQPETQVARATSYDHQILRPSRLVDDKAVLVTRVTVI